MYYIYINDILIFNFTLITLYVLYLYILIELHAIQNVLK